MTRPAWRPSSRQLLGAAAILLGSTFLAPLWSTRMEAPQYRNEEALRVDVYPGRVTGDIEEIETLNQYVGVRLPLDTPELAASPWVVAALAALTLVVLALPLGWRPAGALLSLVAMLGLACAGGALLQYRLWQMGHVRDDAIMEGVPDFTPPVLGTAKIANFTAEMSLGLGGWAYALAMVLVGAAFFRARRERRDTSTLDSRASAIGEGASHAEPIAHTRG